MKIITKYYDKDGKLRVLKDGAEKADSIIRFKVFNGKEFPCCDFRGRCTNFAHAEVFPSLIDKRKKGWSYLCRKHYFLEQKRLKGKLPACFKVEW